MCGRFALYSSVTAIMEYADALRSTDNFDKNYNVFPGTNIPVIHIIEGEKVVNSYRWGLIPVWAKDTKIGNKLINARSETIDSKPSFKNAFQKRRCLIPANGYYEWRKSDKQPFYFHLKEKELFCFAGIWESWSAATGKEINSCCLITTQANDDVRSIHHRMPVILDRENEAIWLTAGKITTEEKEKILSPYAEGAMEIYPVSKAVSKGENHSSLINRISEHNFVN